MLFWGGMKLEIQHPVAVLTADQLLAEKVALDFEQNIAGQSGAGLAEKHYWLDYWAQAIDNSYAVMH